jgi:peptidoglycan biosynthesis protein MviN/MurJ (putative lipid II flippase)
MAVSGVVGLAIPLIVLAWRAQRTSMPASATRPAGEPLRHRLALFLAAAAIPLSLQLAYVVSLPFAGRLGSGAVTSFGYAYLAATTVAGITAFSIGLVSSVPLSRIDLTPAAVARHVVAASWVALVLVGAAVGVLALAGAELVETFLGAAYGDEVGDVVAALIVVLAPWMVASVGVNVSFPLAFVAERLRALPVIAAVALVAQIALAWIGFEILELDGLAVALTLSTLLVLAALLRELGALEAGLRGIVSAAVAIAAVALAAFLVPALLLGTVVAALVGIVLYVALVVAWRPVGLTRSWSYLRALR